MTALGFIETKGLLAAIEAADAMVKAADVRLIEKSLVGGGLVTIIIGGEVSAVRASVDAAITAVRRIDGSALVSEHVIARPYEEVSQLIATKEFSTEPATRPVIEGEVEASAEVEVLDVTQESEDVTVLEGVVETPDVKETPVVEAAPAQEHYTISELKKSTVSKLRQIAWRLSDISLTSEEVKTATKKKLIEAILNATNR